jgi:hypothetical protein
MRRRRSYDLGKDFRILGGVVIEVDVGQTDGAIGQTLQLRYRMSKLDGEIV